MKKPKPKPKPKAYVAGFMFSESEMIVALIRKNKPDWQNGLLNGIGGKIEPGEKPIDAMVREFREETGVETTPSEWRHYSTFRGNKIGNWVVYFFMAKGDLYRLQNITDEEIVCTSAAFVQDRRDIIPNLKWLVPMALDRSAKAEVTCR